MIYTIWRRKVTNTYIAGRNNVENEEGRNGRSVSHINGKLVYRQGKQKLCTCVGLFLSGTTAQYISDKNLKLVSR